MSAPGCHADRLARLALPRLVEPGSWPVHEAVAEHGAQEVVAALREGRPLGAVSAVLAAAAAARAEGYVPGEDLRRLEAVGGRLVCPDDEEWPAHRLTWSRGPRLLDAPPLALQVRGPHHLGALVARSVAVVGARAATAYGEHVARELSLGLADRGQAVVSGGAYGIDGAAHRGALTSATGTTVGVLACGVDVAYPRGNDRLLARIAQVGLTVSEHAPGSSPTRPRFLVRNRLIAALTTGTVVVEAAPRSGSLSTAGRARDLLRHVMAVPGPVTSPLSAGCHQLLRGEPGEAAVLVTGVREVMEVVGALSDDAVVPERGEQRLRDELPAQVRQVLEALPVRGGAGEATIARAAGVPVLVVQQVLPPLLVQGLVERGDDGWRLTSLGAGRPAPRGR